MAITIDSHLYRIVLAYLLIMTFVTKLEYVHAQDDVPWTARQDVIEKFSKRNKFNYIESEVPAYSLPDSLNAADGSVVKSAKQWNEFRREEILNLFRDQVYGFRPSTKYKLSFQQIAEEKNAVDGIAIGKSMIAKVIIGQRSYEWPFILFLPKKTQAPVPAIIHINNRYFTPLKDAATRHDPFWSVRQILERGYATASFHTSHVDPDKKNGYADGIRAFFAEGDLPTDSAWRALSAWGWAASRLLDYFETTHAIDEKRIAVVGHSRGGKASLWAAAEDERFAIAYSNNSGCGGAALSRRVYGETVSRITTSFPYWFCANFAAYGGKEYQLPVDQHQLIGLIAPRGVYVTSADEDLWADPKGEYTSIVESAPVFKLLGKNSITQSIMPALNKPRIVGQTGYHIRTKEHDLKDKDWEWFLNFADSLLK